MPAKVALEHAARLAAHLSMQRELGKYCDVCVCVSDKKFLAHKCVLSANSSKLDALILDAIGQSSNSQDIEIEIQGVSPVGFEKLLEYFYVGELNLEPHTVMPVWMTAAYLELPDVVAMCNDYCQRSVTCVSNQNMDEASKQINSGTNSLQTTGTTVVISTLSPPNPGGSPTATPSTETSGLQNENLKYNQLCNITVPNKEPDLSQPEDGQITDEGAIAWTSLQTATGGEYHPANNSTVDQNFYQTNDNQTSWSQHPTTYQNQSTLSKHTMQTYKMNQNQSVIELNKLPGGVKISGDDRSECEDIMLEVERLRIQHQQLKRMQHQQQLGNNTPPFSVQPNIVPAYSPSTNLQQNMNMEQPTKKKAKRKKSSHSTDSELDSSNSLISYIPDHNQQQQQHQQLIHHTIGNGVAGNQSSLISTQPPPDFRIVTPEYKETLYVKHPKISKEPPMAASTTVTELLQRGKSRKRKSAEQNALNTTIRSILDTLEIVDSSDPKVEDALFLIMDRFESLRDGINIPTVRRSLLVKVRHSIHCKKWRVKRQMLKDQNLHGMIQEDEFKDEEFHKLLKAHPNEDNLHG